MPTLEISRGEMTYTDSGGSGYPLLFLHGTGCDSVDWSPVIKRLPGEVRAIVPDFRGHGQSTVPTTSFTLNTLADDVLYLVKTLHLQEVLLIGHSLGGMVAMEVARRSASVSGLVLLEGWTSLAAAGTAFDAGRFYGTLSDTAIAKIQRKSERTRGKFQSDVWDDFWESVKSFDGYAYLKHATIPIYEVFGEKGRNASTERRLRIPSTPNIRWVWIANAGHYLPHECPTEASEVIYLSYEEASGISTGRSSRSPHSFQEPM